VPGPAVDVPLGHRGGQRAVQHAPVAGVGGRVDRRPGQRVRELDPAGPDRHQPGPLGGGQPADVEVERPAGPGHRGQVAVAGGGQQQHPVGVRVEPGGPAGEPGRDPGRHRHRRARGDLAQPLGLGDQRDHRQRVAAGGPMHLRERGGRDLGAALPGQLAGAGEVEAGQRPGRQAGLGQRPGLAEPGGGQHEHRVGQQPAAGECQRLGRRPVEQVGVVDDQPERAVLAPPDQQAEHRGPDREPVRHGAGPQRQRDAEGLRLRPGQPVEVGHGRPEQLGQPAERHLPLGLGAGRPQQPCPGGDRRGVVQQRRLADPGLAGEHEHAAAAESGTGHDRVDGVPLGVPPDQHRLSVD
jgi:hypothetical protein